MPLLILLLLAPPLPPGRYLGTGPGGTMVLELGADGSAVLGGAALRWRAAGDALIFEGGPAPLRLRVDAGPCLVGPIVQRLCLKPAPLPALRLAAPPAARGADLVGAWAATEPGDTFTLQLGADGAFVTPDAAGRWHVADGALVLTFDGGGAVLYRARRDGAHLRLAGGALAGELVLRSVAPETDPSL